MSSEEEEYKTRLAGCLFCGMRENDIFNSGRFLKVVHPHKSEQWGYAHPACILEAAYNQYISKEAKKNFRQWLGL